jgi:hypothetical protein
LGGRFHKHRKGHAFPVRVSAAPLRDENGAIFGIVGFSTALDQDSGSSKRQRVNRAPKGRLREATRVPSLDAREALEEVLRLSNRSVLLAEQTGNSLLSYLVRGAIREVELQLKIMRLASRVRRRRPSGATANKRTKHAS